MNEKKGRNAAAINRSGSNYTESRAFIVMLHVLALLLCFVVFTLCGVLP